MNIIITENQGFDATVGAANSWEQFASMAYNRIDVWNEVSVSVDGVTASKEEIEKQVMLTSLDQTTKEYVVNNLQLA